MATMPPILYLYHTVHYLVRGNTVWFKGINFGVTISSMTEYLIKSIVMNFVICVYR